MKHLLLVQAVLILVISVSPVSVARFPDLEDPTAVVIDHNQLFITEGVTIYIYSLKDFKLQKKFGKSGPETQEFKPYEYPNLPIYINVLPNRVMVESFGRISYFTRKGNFLGLLQPRDYFMLAKPVGENFAAYRYTRRNNTWYICLDLYNSRFEIYKELLRLRDSHQPRERDKLLSRAWTYCTYGNQLFTAVKKDFIIDVFDHRGEKLSSINKEYEKVKVTKAYIKSSLDLIWRSFRKQRVIVLLAILALAGGYSLYNASRIPVVKELTVPLKKLPQEMSGFTIVQVSDFHLGDLVSPSWFEKTVEKINSLQPHLIVITGDLIDKGISDESRFLDSLKKLDARFGKFAVTGNHEYYNNRLHFFLDIAKKAGIQVLRNNSVTINRGVQLVGMNNWNAGMFDEDDFPPSLGLAMRHVDKRKPVIMLFHSPGMFEQGIQRGVDLQLSGHTHAGQIPPLDLLSYLLEDYFYGLYQEGESYIYVTCGTGLYSTPMRLFSRNEIARITLVSVPPVE